MCAITDQPDASFAQGVATVWKVLYLAKLRSLTILIDGNVW